MVNMLKFCVSRNIMRIWRHFSVSVTFTKHIFLMCAKPSILICSSLVGGWCTDLLIFFFFIIRSQINHYHLSIRCTLKWLFLWVSLLCDSRENGKRSGKSKFSVVSFRYLSFLSVLTSCLLLTNICSISVLIVLVKRSTENITLDTHTWVTW